jgi:hypothetical protein
MGFSRYPFKQEPQFYDFWWHRCINRAIRICKGKEQISSAAQFNGKTRLKELGCR